jgi:hypothetical protein
MDVTGAAISVAAKPAYALPTAADIAEVQVGPLPLLNVDIPFISRTRCATPLDGDRHTRNQSVTVWSTVPRNVMRTR